ncbi:unnamed protein product, partial [Rotaria sp. Silwood1]
MLAQGVITPSKSPWASPVVLALKKDGSIRFCIDYRKLNDVTIRDAYPIPRIDDTLDALQHAQFVSTLDLRSGYWQVEMDDNSRPITAFVTHKGLFECNVMPFGLTNAPATFQRLMDIVLADACEYGIGCVLTQEYENRKYVIAYASRTLSIAERNYSSVEREALAIVWATKHFRQYLEGGPVLVRSDCKALEWLKTARDPTGRLARWAMKLSPYNIIIQHRPGVSNPNGDFVSRYPLPDTDSTTSELNSIESGLNILEGTNILDDIRSQQKNDPRLAPIFQSLEENPSLPFGAKQAPYILLNNTLYKVRHINSYHDQRRLGNKHLLVIPQSLQRQVLMWAHDHPTAGHAGRIKTLFRLSSR